MFSRFISPSYIFSKKGFLCFVVLFTLSFVWTQNTEAQVVRRTIRRISDAVSKRSEIIKEDLQERAKLPLREKQLTETTKKALQDITLYTTLAEITSPIKPFVYGPYAIFVYYDEIEDTRVNIGFQDENYFVLYPFVRLATNKRIQVFITENTKPKVHYRLVINGVWTYDNQNQDSIIDTNGIRVSFANFRPYLGILSPSVVYNKQNNTLRFYFNLDATLQLLQDTSLNTVDIAELKHKGIYLVGNFTAWDPFFLKMHPSDETPNLYYVDVEANTGAYYYYFQVGNYNLLDPKNQNVRPRRGGFFYVNTFEVKETTDKLTGAIVKLVQNYS